MYECIVIGPRTSFVVCNWCCQIVIRVICPVFYVEWFLHGVVINKSLYPLSDNTWMHWGTMRGPNTCREAAGSTGPPTG